jgi:hypothetical protein
MGLGAARGRRVIVVGFFAGVAVACGGQSERAEGEGGSAGSPSSTGGGDSCPECADENYGIVINGHGGPR